MRRPAARANTAFSLRFAASDRDGGIDAPTVPGLKRLLLEIGVGVRVRVPHSHSMISDARNPHECLLCRVGASYSSIVNYH